MVTRYIEPQNCRFVRERIDGVEQIRIPMRRNWFVLLFYCFWLCMWTAGGGMAMVGLTQTHDLFLVFWVAIWAVGWLFAATTIALQIAGTEIIRVDGRDLETSVGIGALRWRRVYRGDHIRNLTSSDPNPWGWPWRMPRNNLLRPSQGAIKFDYGARTIHAASSAEEAEGRMIVDWLTTRLPRTATEPAA
jgi:hypothetical protein